MVLHVLGTLPLNDDRYHISRSQQPRRIWLLHLVDFSTDIWVAVILQEEGRSVLLLAKNMGLPMHFCFNFLVIDVDLENGWADSQHPWFANATLQHHDRKAC